MSPSGIGLRTLACQKRAVSGGIQNRLHCQKCFPISAACRPLYLQGAVHCAQNATATKLRPHGLLPHVQILTTPGRTRERSSKGRQCIYPKPPHNEVMDFILSRYCYRVVPIVGRCRVANARREVASPPGIAAHGESLDKNGQFPFYFSQQHPMRATVLFVELAEFASHATFQKRTAIFAPEPVQAIASRRYAK